MPTGVFPAKPRDARSPIWFPSIGISVGEMEESGDVGEGSEEETSGTPSEVRGDTEDVEEEGFGNSGSVDGGTESERVLSVFHGSLTQVSDGETAVVASSTVPEVGLAVLGVELDGQRLRLRA